MFVSDWIEAEFERICVEIEEEERIEFVGLQIELDLGEGSSIHDDLPAVEVPGVVPTVVVEEEDSSMEIVISGREMKLDQAEGTGTEPVPEDALLREAGQAVGTGEPVLVEDRSGEEPDLMETDEAVRTGDVPVREVLETGTGSEPVPEEAERGTGVVPDLGSGEGDLHFEDFPGDEFKKVGDFTTEDSTQTPPAPETKHPAETPSGEESRKKRVKTLAGRTELPWVRKLKALKAKTSSSSQKSPPKQPSQPTRKSYRLAVQGIRSSSMHQGSPVIEEISSSSEGSPAPTLLLLKSAWSHLF